MYCLVSAALSTQVETVLAIQNPLLWVTQGVLYIQQSQNTPESDEMGTSNGLPQFPNVLLNIDFEGA